MKRVLFLLLFSAAVLVLAMSEGAKVTTSNLRLTQIAGHELFVLKDCTQCHTLAAKTEGERTPVPNKRDDAWFKEHVSTESTLVLAEAKSKGKKRRILKKELVALSDFLFESSVNEKTQVKALASNVRQGAYLGYQNNCIGCHKIAGGGKEIGPELTHVADKRGDRKWLIKNLKNPLQFAPESPMPAFEGKLSKEEMGKIADYLLTLRK